MGDFSKISNPALKMARAGQSMSTGQTFVLDPDVNIEIIEDTYSLYDKHNFTDGIGMISLDLTEKINKKIGIPQATAFQVRLWGGKGMLILNM